MINPRVLITNGQLRKSLASARSLGEKGIPVFSGEVTRFNITAFSRYCVKSFIYPDPSDKPGHFYQWLLNFVRDNPGTLLLPMDDSVLEIVFKHRIELKKYCILSLPPLSSYEIASDKGLSALAAIDCGLDCPGTYIPSSIDDAFNHAKASEYPLVIKPRKSSGSRGIRIVKDRNEFKINYEKIARIYGLPVIQEFIPTGERYDVCLFYNSSNDLKASFVQKELRHFPPDIGPSTLQESISMPGLSLKALKLMEKLPWEGVVEIEFMKDPRDGKFKFMEINPRFWNSLHLSIISGVDFPVMFYNNAIGINVENIRTYKKGILCRWLLPGDILRFIFDKKGFSPSFKRVKIKGRKIYDDILSIRDLGPLLGFILSFTRYVFDIRMWRFIFKR